MAYLAADMFIIISGFLYIGAHGASHTSCTPVNDCTTAAGSKCKICLEFELEAGEIGLYKPKGYNNPSPDITVQIGKTYIFDQGHPSNWYHPIGFAYFPDGAHGDTWGGDERAEVEAAAMLQYKIVGADGLEQPQCPDFGDTGLDCYEPEFFYPKGEWGPKHYTAELTITQAMADESHGGVIYYFCHIHSKMSGKIIIQNADGSVPVTKADGSALTNPNELPLYAPPTRSAADQKCGTLDLANYFKGGSKACSHQYLKGSMDTDFEDCLQGIDCQMNKEMRVKGYDNHNEPIVTFMQQMIPHHINAINMARTTIKHDSSYAQVEDMEDILWDVINVQGYQVHQFRNYLAGKSSYTQISHDGQSLGATSVGEHCTEELSGSVTIPGSTPSTSASSNVAGCVNSDTNFCMKVNMHAGETGYYEIAGKSGVSPDLTVQIGKTYVFDQKDASNWYHPVGFAYYPDGAHGENWGGDERAEVEAAGQLLYKINGAATTCPEAGDTGLDCYEPEFFHPRGDWKGKHYTAELTITQAMADASHGGVIYYFCHIHSKMSGKIIIQNADGSAVTKADGSALPHPTEHPLYQPVTLSDVDATCGTDGLAPYSGSGSMACSERFLCGTLDSNFEKCMQAIDCKMNKHMKEDTSPDTTNKLALFCQQMIPHHINAISMAKILLKTVSASAITNAMEEDGLTDILYSIIAVQGHQVHVFRNYLASQGFTVAAQYPDVVASKACFSQRSSLALTFIVAAMIHTCCSFAAHR